MKSIYLLRGAANKGKSTTLNDLAFQLFELFPHKLTYFERIGDLDYLATWNDKNTIIGIYSGGDNKEIVFRNLNALHSLNCNYIIGVTRTSGGSCEAAESYAELFDKEIEWIDKESPDDIDNNKCQRKLLKIIQKIWK